MVSAGSIARRVKPENAGVHGAIRSREASRREYLLDRRGGSWGVQLLTALRVGRIESCAYDEVSDGDVRTREVAGQEISLKAENPAYSIAVVIQMM